jgi:hypothetical protein
MKKVDNMGDMTFSKREFLEKLPEWYWGAVSGYGIPLK